MQPIDDRSGPTTSAVPQFGGLGLSLWGAFAIALGLIRSGRIQGASGANVGLTLPLAGATLAGVWLVQRYYQRRQSPRTAGMDAPSSSAILQRALPVAIGVMLLLADWWMREDGGWLVVLGVVLAAVGAVDHRAATRRG